jgi:hypothetical protein
MDALAALIAVPLICVAIWTLFTIGLIGAPEEESPKDGPIFVELGVTTLRAEVAMTAVESDFRARGLIHEAEGARQMRAAVKSLLATLGEENGAE